MCVCVLPERDFGYTAKMSRKLLIFLLGLNMAGIALAQKGADPTQRYFRLICLVHLNGSGQKGDPVVPEYVVQGVSTAQAAMQARAVGGNAVDAPAQSATAAMSPRPGILAWSMQMTDDKHMAIIQIVAADWRAFDAVLSDKRAEIRVFEIGKDKKGEIEKEMRKYKKDFDLASFQVAAE